MFRLQDAGAKKTVDIEIDGQRESVPDGITVAAAMLLRGYTSFRHTPRNGSPRAVYCMIGHCFECLLEIDGRANRRACQQEVHQGMQIRRSGDGDR